MLGGGGEGAIGSSLELAQPLGLSVGHPRLDGLPRKGQPRQAPGVAPVGLSRAVIGAGGDVARGHGHDPAPLGRELPGRDEAGAAGPAGPVGRLREPRRPLGHLAVGVPAEGPRPRLARRGVHGAHGGGAGVWVDPENKTARYPDMGPPVDVSCGERHRRPREAPFPEPPAVTLGSGHIVWLRPSAPVGDSGMPR